MRIFNQTKNVLLADEAITADSVFKRLKGLLGRKEFKKGEALILQPCKSIHTFFMRFPIDVLFVDKHNKVIKSIAHLEPFRFTRLYVNAAFVIELPEDTIRSSLTSENHELRLE
jgi:uncharacterized membrane protein (UPF0127 family)